MLPAALPFQLKMSSVSFFAISVMNLTASTVFFDWRVGLLASFWMKLPKHIMNAIRAMFESSSCDWPIPSGPHGRLGLEHLMGTWNIWKFAKNKDAAQQFLVDLLIAGKDATIQSQLYNFPTFANAMPFKDIRKFAAADTHKPKGKYTILTTIAEKYTHNIGYPGTTNAAIDEIFQKFLIPQMFAQVSQGRMSAEDSVRQTNAALKTIYAKWRNRNMI